MGRLKDAALSESKARELYRSVLVSVRKMYHQCKLVHGDLSEYNMLYHQGDAFIIDVSQSVEHDHPHALEFLRKDLHNITEFFRKLGVAVLGLRELFDWVVDTRENWEERLDALAEIAAERTEEERDAQAVVDEEDETSEEDGEDISDDNEEEKKEKFVSSARSKHETLIEKKERKKAIREAKADKRKDKVPKHLKKRKEQAGRSKVK